MRLRSSPLLAVVQPQTLRLWLATKAGCTGKPKSLNDLEPEQLQTLQKWLEVTSNESLEAQFHAFLKG